MESLVTLHKIKYRPKIVSTLNWDCNSMISRLTRQNLRDHIFSLVNFFKVVPLYGAYLTHDAFLRASNNKIYKNHKYSNSFIKTFISLFCTFTLQLHWYKNSN